MESMTDWAFSWPISALRVSFLGQMWVGLGIGCTLVVVYDISQMIPAAVVGFPHAHGVVGEVDIAVVALNAWLVGLTYSSERFNLQKSA